MKRKRDGETEGPDLKKRKIENEGDGRSLFDPIWLLDEKERCIKLKEELKPYSFFQHRENEYRERKWRLARLAAYHAYEELEFCENFTMYQNQLGWMNHGECSIPYRERLEKKFKKLLDSEKVKDIVHYMNEEYLFSDDVKQKIRWFLNDDAEIESDKEDDLFP